MTYYQYLRLMWWAERFYDFHPEYFADLDRSKRMAMRRAFLYDFDDTHEDGSDYPASIADYYKKEVEPDKSLQDLALAGVTDIYKASGMGEFRLSNIPDERP